MTGSSFFPVERTIGREGVCRIERGRVPRFSNEDSGRVMNPAGFIRVDGLPSGLAAGLSPAGFSAIPGALLLVQPAGPGDQAGGCGLGRRATHAVRRPPGLAHRSPTMPLTAFQQQVLAELAASEGARDRYLAGGAALHFAPNFVRSQGHQPPVPPCGGDGRFSAHRSVDDPGSAP